MREKLKINTALLVVFIIIGGLFFIGKTGFNMLSGLRAYVNGEGLWAKGQKEATYQLTQYIFTGEKIRYQSFLNGLKVPLGDRIARIELEKPNSDHDIIYQGFLDGGNHPEDIPTMIFLYQKFRNSDYIKQAIEQWETGDRHIQDLLEVGEEVHQLISSKSFNRNKTNSVLAEIDLLQGKLTEAENKFSYNMSEAARWAAGLLFRAMLVFTVVGSLICFFIVRLIAEIVWKLDAKNKQLEQQAESEKSIRKELKESEERFRRLAENALDMIYRMSLPDGKYEYVSPAANEIFGYKPQEFYDSPALIKNTIHPDWKEYFAYQWEKLIAGEMPPFYEYQIIHKSGEERWLNQRNVLVRDDSGKPIAIEGIVTDVTSQKRFEEEKGRYEQQLRHAHKMEAIGTLAGGIAHDFNNILTAILGYANLAKHDIEDGANAKQQIDEVLVAGNRAKTLVKQILAFSRKTELKREPTKIHLLVKEVIDFLRATIPSTIKIIHNIDSPRGGILADPTQIHQVLMNLCTNAAHAMEENGGVLSIDLHETSLTETDLDKVSTGQPGPYILLTVTDTGSGIPKECIDRIFDPYFTTKEVGKGSGMGLAVVHGIMKSHMGFVTVESTPGKGSTFKLYFPKVDIEDTVHRSSQVTEALPTGKERVLIVDDEESIARLIERQMKHLGYAATAKTDSKEVLDLFRADPDAFDIVITDQTMPQMTGERLSKELLNIRPDVPIIMCTGYSASVDADKADEIGIRAFIMKPVDTVVLAKTVRKILDDS